jgi:hypothetical protein
MEDRHGMVVIEEMQFSGFPGRDQDGLRHLTYAGRVAWFRYRFNLVFLTPFQRFIALEGPDCYTWLCVMNLAGSAIEALANLCVPQGQDHQKFPLFLERFFQGFRDAALQLDDPRRGRGEARTAAEHFYKYFRSGLVHTFCIEWGGLQHREEIREPIVGYLFATTQGFDGRHGLGIIPRDFVADFEQACGATLEAFAGAPEGDVLRESFDRAFNRVFLLKNRPPLP